MGAINPPERLEEVTKGAILMDDKGYERFSSTIVAKNSWAYKKHDAQVKRDTLRLNLVKDEDYSLEKANEIVEELYDDFLSRNKPLMWRILDKLYKS